MIPRGSCWRQENESSMELKGVAVGAGSSGFEHPLGKTERAAGKHYYTREKKRGQQDIHYRHNAD